MPDPARWLGHPGSRGTCKPLHAHERLRHQSAQRRAQDNNTCTVGVSVLSCALGCVPSALVAAHCCSGVVACDSPFSPRVRWQNRRATPRCGRCHDCNSTALRRLSRGLQIGRRHAVNARPSHAADSQLCGASGPPTVGGVGRAVAPGRSAQAKPSQAKRRHTLVCLLPLGVLIISLPLRPHRLT